MSEARFLRSVPSRLRTVIIAVLAIYGAVLLVTALGYRIVGGWLANRGTAFPSQILVVTALLVGGVIVTDLVTRTEAGEAPKSVNDRFNISDAELKFMARVIPIGFCFVAMMAYGFISSGGWGVIPHSPATPYQIFLSHSRFSSVVSEARYQHVIEANLLFTVGMSLILLTVTYGISCTMGTSKTPE